MHKESGNLQAEKRAMGVRVAREDRPEGGYLARLVIDNASKLNALNRELMVEIVEAVKALEVDPELRLVIVTGAGERAFVGGADINELAALDTDSAREFITLVHRCCDGFHRLSVPVIARIDGYALGAGLELAAACDLRVASNRAVFGMPEVRVGIPSVVEAALLPQLIGYGRARRLLLTGVSIDADRPELFRIGAQHRRKRAAQPIDQRFGQRLRIAARIAGGEQHFEDLVIGQVVGATGQQPFL